MDAIRNIIKTTAYAGHRPLMLGMLFLSFLRTVRDLVCLIAISYATDQILSGGDVVRALLTVTIFELTGTPIMALDAYICQRYRAETENSLMKQLLRKFGDMPLTQLEHCNSAELVSSATTDLQKYLVWLSDTCPNAFRTITYLIAGLCYALSKSVSMTLLVFPVVIAVIPMLLRLSKPLEKAAAGQRLAAAQSLKKSQEALKNPEFIKAYSLEETVDFRVGEELAARCGLEIKAGKALAGMKGISKLTSYLPSMLAAGFGFIFLFQGKISIGFLFGFVQMTAQRFGFVIPQISDIMAATMQASASASRLNAVLDMPKEREDGDIIQTDEDLVLELNEVFFGYSPEKRVLNGISLYARKGETIALVGGSGCGKSTALKLLMGIYEPDGGTVKCMGRSTALWNPKALRARIAPVFQQPFLFPMTLRENLSEGGHTDEQILEAIKKAGLESFFSRLPEGLDTFISQGASSLSGGERQRLTLARAWLKDAPILILDEPTSALDAVTESAIQKELRELRRGRTAVIVAHRLHTVMDADRIYCFKDGRIAEQGTHAELLKLGGVYRRLFEAGEGRTHEG